MIYYVHPSHMAKQVLFLLCVRPSVRKPVCVSLHAKTLNYWLNLHYLPTKVDALCYHHTYRTFSLTIIQSDNLGHRLSTYFQNQQLLPHSNHKPYSVSVPAVWNSLKPDLYSVDCLGSFKAQLRSTTFPCSLRQHEIARSRATKHFLFAACMQPEHSANCILYCIEIGVTW